MYFEFKLVAVILLGNKYKISLILSMIFFSFFITIIYRKNINQDRELYFFLKLYFDRRMFIIFWL